MKAIMSLHSLLSLLFERYGHSVLAQHEGEENRGRFISAHVHDRGCTIAFVGNGGDVTKARLTVQVGGDPGGDSNVVPGINGRGGELQAQVAARGIHKVWVGVDVAVAVRATGGIPAGNRVATAIDVAIGDGGGGAFIVDFRPVIDCIAPHDDIRQRRAAVAVVHPAPVVTAGVVAKGDIRQRGVAVVPVGHPAARTRGGRVGVEDDIRQRGAAVAV